MDNKLSQVIGWKTDGLIFLFAIASKAWQSPPWRGGHNRARGKCSPAGLRFHAWLLGPPLAEPAERASVRLIGVDRPGIGLSDFKPGRKILDWVDDVIELADAIRNRALRD